MRKEETISFGAKIVMKKATPSNREDEQKQDAERIRELADWLDAEIRETVSCGNDGIVEAKMVKEVAREVIRIVANYI